MRRIFPWPTPFFALVMVCHGLWGPCGRESATTLIALRLDAVLGAASLGDIGQHFPPSDERFRDADSQLLLREVARLAREAGWVPGNVDATLLAEAPSIA